MDVQNAVENLNPAKRISEAIDKGSKSVSDMLSNAASRAKSVLNGPSPSTTYKYDQKAVAPKPKPAPAPTKHNPAPKLHSGTDNVPKTGTYTLKKGEAVLNNKDAEHHRALHGAMGALGGHEHKPEKKIKHITTKKSADGKGHIHVHVHTHPEHHPDEEHISMGNDGLMSHMMDHMGEPNPGEAEADAGQSGIPPQAAAAGPQACPAMGE